jgi:hypothetical protein
MKIEDPHKQAAQKVELKEGSGTFTSHERRIENAIRNLEKEICGIDHKPENCPQPATFGYVYRMQKDQASLRRNLIVLCFCFLVLIYLVATLMDKVKLRPVDLLPWK